jgi:hypothetical protein
MVLVKELCVIRHFFIGLHAQMVYGCAAIFSDIGRSISIIADIGSIQEIRYRSSFPRRRRLGRHNLPPRHAGHLAFLKKHRRTPEHIVIIDDISRLARAFETRIQLLTETGDGDGRLESPSIEFGEDSDSRLIENLRASPSTSARKTPNRW